MEITFPRRYRGPLTSANGGYACGRLAAFVDADEVEVTLRLPPPLDRPLAVERDGDGVLLLDGDAVVAEARPAPVEIEPPAPVSIADAEAARERHVRGVEPRLPRVLRLRRSRGRPRDPRRARSPGASRCTRRRSRLRESGAGDRLGRDRLPGRVRGRRRGPRRHRARPHDGARRPRARGRRAVRRHVVAARRGRPQALRRNRALRRRTASCSRSRKQVWIAAAAASAGVSASSRPPSSSYAGKKSTTTRFSMPALVRISSSWPIFRTPHSRTTSIGDDVGERERLDDLAADEVGVAVPGQLEDAAPGGEDARVAVADDEAGLGRRVVVLEQLVEEPERAAPALDGLRREPVVPVEVDRALLAVGADEERHAGAG